MRAFVTGATGFIGGRTARRLRGRSDEVVALVRDPGRAGALRALGFCFVHVDDVADGILLALDRGRIGESYNLAGERATIGDLIDATARSAGRSASRRGTSKRSCARR